MTNLAELKFLITPPHSCGYLDDRQATTLFADPVAAMDNNTYSALSTLGFRRSGDHVYRPHCTGCKACVPVRIPAADFTPRRCQRRIWRRNADLEVNIRDPDLTEENYALYARYIKARHATSDMYPPSIEQFCSFLLCDWSRTQFAEFREPDGGLVAVAVIDQIQDALSAVYTFYDPERAGRSLGTYCVLWLLQRAHQTGQSYVYLGYWIRQCPKMNYKSDYRPLEGFVEGRWTRISGKLT